MILTHLPIWAEDAEIHGVVITAMDVTNLSAAMRGKGGEVGMTEQEKRENAIKGLKCVAETYKFYLHDLATEAIDLLKAQEPRAMTLSGVRNLKESTPVWLEDVDKKDVIGALFMRDYSGTKCVDFAIMRDWEFERVVADYMDYGVRWRCWTSRPTDEQREATPWHST